MKLAEPLDRETVYTSEGYGLVIVSLQELFGTVVWTEQNGKTLSVYYYRDAHPSKPFPARRYHLTKLGQL